MKSLKLETQDLFCEVAVNKYPKVAEPKCKIEPTGAGEDKTMFVYTS